MVLISNSAVLSATPEEAFDYLSDLRTGEEWNPTCESAEKIADGPFGEKMKFRMKWKSTGWIGADRCEPPRTTMASSHSSRIFASGSATTLYVTIPAQIVSDSQFPFNVEDTLTVSIEKGQLIIAPETDTGNTR